MTTRTATEEAVLAEALDLDVTTTNVGRKNRALAQLCEGLKGNAGELANTAASYKHRNITFKEYLDDHEAAGNAKLARLREQTDRLAAANAKLEARHAARSERR